MRLLIGTWEASDKCEGARHKWRPHEAEKSEVIRSGGVARSSVETFVREAERRGNLVLRDT